jgi:hypothetical protein
LKRFILFFLFILMFISCSDEIELQHYEQGDISILLTQSPSEVLPGQSINLLYKIKGKGIHTLYVSETPDMVEQLHELTSQIDQNTFLWKITADRGGSYTLPQRGFTLEVDGVEQPLVFPSVEIQVKSLADLQSPLRDIEGPKKIGFLRSIYKILILVLILIIVFIVWYVLYKKKHGKQQSMSLSLQLQQTLEKLDLQEYIEREDSPEFYNRLTSVIRLFVDRIYGTTTLEQTRQEFMPQILKVRAFKKREKSWIIELMERSDRSKYGNIPNPKETMKEDLALCRDWFKEMILLQKDREVLDNGIQ